MRKTVLIFSMCLFLVSNLMSETFANDISSSNICAKKFSNTKEIKVCEDIIKNKAISIENKDRNYQLLTQKVTRKLFDFFNSEWHDNTTLDYEKTNFTVLIANKFSDKINHETGLFETELSNKLFELII